MSAARSSAAESACGSTRRRGKCSGAHRSKGTSLVSRVPPHDRTRLPAADHQRFFEEILRMDVNEHSDAFRSEECAELLKALSEPLRLRIVDVLRHGPLTVSDIAEFLEVELVTVSHHLG